MQVVRDREALSSIGETDGARRVIGALTGAAEAHVRTNPHDTAVTALGCVLPMFGDMART
jgi:hypothetical protein